MSPRTRLALRALAAAAALAGAASQLPFRSWIPGRVERTPALEARGRQFAARSCLACHDQIPLAPRVRGWTVGRAYAALGRLPELSPSMPPFPGDEADRRAVAAWLAALGETPPPPSRASAP